MEELVAVTGGNSTDCPDCWVTSDGCCEEGPYDGCCNGPINLEDLIRP